MQVSKVAQVAPSADAEPIPHTMGTLHGAGRLAARIETMPFSRWHAKVLGSIGIIHMTDAFDSLTIAFVLPVLVELWHLTPGKAGMVVSIGYLGQTIGALLFSTLAERYGRIRALRWALVVLSAFSLVSAYASSVGMFVALRFFQGIGLGGESPVSATYMNEISPARTRGRLLFILQTTFAVGNFIAALLAIKLIPTYGWQIMFFIGALPIFMAWALPRLAPESPRWLMLHQRTTEASQIVDQMAGGSASAARNATSFTVDPEPLADATLPPETKSERAPFRVLFSKSYAMRTLLVWLMSACSGLTIYGMLVWLPTLYRTVFHLPLESAMRYGVVSMVAAFVGALLGIFMIDRLGRKWTFGLAFISAALPLLYLALSVLTMSVQQVSAAEVAELTAISIAMIAIVQCGIFVYAPEMYPTQARATGAGAASAVLRLSSVIGPLIIGSLLTYTSIGMVFLYLALVALLGSVAIACFGLETKGVCLDDLATTHEKGSLRGE